MDRVRRYGALMRIFDLIMLALALVCIASPVQAQTYDPSYPICMKVYSSDFGGEWIDCSYTSLPQCHTSASGRAATCVINPYFPHGQIASPRSYRRHHPMY